MLKNLFITVLALTTIYLGWLSFAHATTFKTENTGTALNVQYGSGNQCDWMESKNGDSITVVKDDQKVGEFIINPGELVCPKDRVVTGIAIEKDKVSGSGGNQDIAVINIKVKCCTATVSGLYH